MSHLKGTMKKVVLIVCSLLLASCAHATVPSQMLYSENDSALATQYKVLYGFQSGNDAGYPYARLTNVGGKLFGTTYGGGGGYEWGTVFTIGTDGGEHVLYRFQAGKDGAHPYAGLTELNGVLYGTTYQGGTAGSGTVFAITTAGKEHVVYSFKGGTKDGQYPYSSLLADGGSLYGTTTGGGVSPGWGVVFKVTTSGKESVLYDFKANNSSKSDGAVPYSGLTRMGSKLYGTTYQGGSGGSGTVYSITTGGTERVVYSFQGGTDGQYPYANLVDVKNELYGTTYQGGASTGWGTVFKVNASGSENVLYRFKAGNDGAHPYYSGLLFNGGKFYGTTYQGGTTGSGTVYSMSLGGDETVIHSFKGDNDGKYPYAGLIALNGTFYGTTYNGGGSANAGTVFKLTP